MAELNKANRQVCDVDIRILKTMAPFLFFDTANTTTAGLTGESVYAMAKGSKKIAFQDPIDGTMTIEAQVYPFKFFSLLSDGVVEDSAVYADTQTVVCEETGSLTLDIPETAEIESGTVFVYPEDSFGDEASLIDGTYADGVFTATNRMNITADESYTVGYVVNRTGVSSIAFNNSKLPPDYYITMDTVDKDDQGVYTPFKMTAYKASIQRSFDLSFSSEGDPATVTLTFDLLEDKDGNIFRMTEIADESY